MSAPLGMYSFMTYRDMLGFDKVPELFKNRPQKAVVKAHPSAPVSEVLSILKQNDVTSIVLHDYTNDKYIGIVSVLDIAGVLSKQYTEAKTSEQKFNLEIPVRDVLGITHESSLNYLWKVTVNDTMADVFDLFGGGLHHALVIDVQANQQHFISQSDALRYIVSNKVQFESILSKTLDQLNMATVPIHTVHRDTPAINALKIICEQHLKAIAVLDDQNKLHKELSSAEIRGLTSENLSDLFSPVYQFINTHSNNPFVPPIHVKHSVTLGSVAETLLEKHAHRAWVLDADNKLVGVVTLTDIIAKFSPSLSL